MPDLRFHKYVRLPDFDYSSPGWYFVTICTDFRKTLFVPSISHRYNHVVPVVAASHAAEKLRTKLFEETLLEIGGKYFDNLEIDFYSIMPDHVHIIFVFNDYVTKRGEIGSRHYKLADIVTTLKAITSRKLKFKVWQDNYYEHIIRSESSLDRIRNYILHNPDAIDFDWRRLDPRPA